MSPVVAMPSRPQTPAVGASTLRTLVISRNFPPRVGGTPTWFYEVYRRYPRGQALVMTDRQAGDEVFDATSDVPVLRSPMQLDDWGCLKPRSALAYLRLTRLAARAARVHDVQIVHCGQVLVEGLIGHLLWRRRGLPYCVYAHGEEIGTARSSRELTFLMRRVYRAAHQIIANSENTRRLLREVGVDDARVVVLHPGVDVERFRPCPDPARAKERLGLSGTKVLLTVGRLQRRKGHDMVIRALPGIAASVPSVRYVIAGVGEEEPRLRALAEEMNVARLVRFAGRVPDEDLLTYYWASDVFVMPNREEAHSDIEGFGIVFLEANACGKPVIGGLSGGTGEAIVDGETGLRVDGTRPQAIVDAAVRVLRDDTFGAAMGRRGYERVVRDFHWDQIAARTRALMPPLPVAAAPLRSI